MLSEGLTSSALEYLHCCPICNGVDLTHYCRVASSFYEGQYINYDRCRSCGNVLRNPRWLAAHGEAKYENWSPPEEEKRLDPTMQKHYRYLVRLIDRLYPKDAPRRMLDFGCGAGGFLLEAREAGFDAKGLEVGREMAEHVRAGHGFEVLSRLGEEQFPLITSLQVFEHLSDPRGTLLELREHLVEPAMIYIEVPNLNATEERFRRGSTMDDSHFTYFSDRGLSHMMREAGFRIVEIHQGVRPYRFLSTDSGLPLGLIRAGERGAALLGLRSVLGILARREN